MQDFILIGTDDPDSKVEKLAQQIETPADSGSLIRTVHKAVNQLRGEGYLLANVDAIEYYAEGKLDIQIFVGPSYEWVLLSLAGLPEDLSNRLKNKPARFTRKRYNKAEIRQLLTEIITYSENHGYPFASIQLDSVRVDDTGISARLMYDPGPFITFDSLNIKGSLKIKTRFLGAYLKILPGKPFDQRLIDHIPEKLERLHYLKMNEMPVTRFQNEECSVHLLLNSDKSNQFDAVIGILPNEKEGRNVLVTGKADIALHHLFRSGKSFEFHWDKTQVATQSVLISYLHPNLFASPIGLLADFYLYKQDTSFINRKARLGFDLLTPGTGTLSFFSKWESSRLIGTLPTDSTTFPADLAEFNIKYVGIQFNNLFSSLQRPPSTHWNVDIQAAFGKKTILKNAGFDDSVYDGVDFETTQFTTEATVSGLFRIKDAYFLYSKIRGGLMVNKRLFLNDLYRLGGLNSIRGFNENFFYASRYLIGTLEFRMYFNSISSLFAFYDQSYIYYNLEDSQYNDTPFGIGLGMNIESGNGLFTLVYALGQTREQPLDFRFSKIHFGYITAF